MKKNRLLICLILFSVLISACSQRKVSEKEASIETGNVGNETLMQEAPASVENYSAYNADQSQKTDRIVIKNAELHLIVIDPITAVDRISKMAEEKGGFVVSSNIYRIDSSSGKKLPAANITIRVPADTLNETMEAIKGLVEEKNVDVINESISGQDVTSEVTDLQSRLRNLQKAEEQLLEIMDKATTTEDVMAVFQQLTSIRENIEVLQGQLKYYDESAKLSAITITLEAKEAVAPITIGGWRPSLTLQHAVQSLVNGLRFIVDALIWIVICIAPIALLIGLPIYFILKASKKHRREKKNSETEKSK